MIPEDPLRPVTPGPVSWFHGGNRSLRAWPVYGGAGVEPPAAPPRARGLRDAPVHLPEPRPGAGRERRPAAQLSRDPRDRAAAPGGPQSGRPGDPAHVPAGGGSPAGTGGVHGFTRARQPRRPLSHGTGS